MILVVLILLNLQVQQTIESEAFIKVTRFNVPPLVPVGAPVRLSCIYELRDETLHAMKLFKDDKEFYRYTPATRREDQKMAFAVKGINVDLARSNESSVLLKGVNKQTSGLFRCQVSVENTFKSVSAEKRLKVEDHNAHRANPGRASAESLLGPTYQQQQNNNNRQAINAPNKPSSQPSFLPSHLTVHLLLGVAQLVCIIFQSARTGVL